MRLCFLKVKDENNLLRYYLFAEELPKEYYELLTSYDVSGVSRKELENLQCATKKQLLNEIDRKLTKLDKQRIETEEAHRLLNNIKKYVKKNG